MFSYLRNETFKNNPAVNMYPKYIHIYIYMQFGCPNKVRQIPIFERLTTIQAELAVKRLDILMWS